MPDADSIRERFRQRYSADATLVARAPGRVNLIGEHTDYSGLPVLPIAIGRAVTVAACPIDGDLVRAASSSFEGEALFLRTAPLEADLPWQRYIAGVLRELAGCGPGRGANLFIESDLPAEGGLSSSSALSVAIVAALTNAWGAPVTGSALASQAAAAERHIGVETGGMDQQVIVGAEAGHALRIDFLPLATRQLLLPEDLRFVIAYSGEAAPKGGAVREAYNERVVGTRIGALMLADMLGVELEGTPLLGHVADIDAATVMVEELPDQMAPRSAANAVEANVDRVIQLSASHFDASRKVGVRPYARHVLAEAERVASAEAALLAGDLKAFGRLLNESHDSLRNDMKCSTPALDKVAAAMRKSGAFGARLTGAGFGGFAFAACPPDKVGSVIAAAEAATGGPAFEVTPSAGLQLL